MPPMWMRGQVLPFYYSVDGAADGAINSPESGQESGGENNQKPEEKKEEWTPERAKNTIDNFRKLEKQWKEDKRELERLKGLHEEAERAKLGDSERAAADLKKAQEALENSQQRVNKTVASARNRIATAAIHREAESSGLSAKLVAKLADLSAVTFSESDDDPIGEPDEKSIKDMVKKLAEEYPELKVGRKEDVPGGPPKQGNPQHLKADDNVARQGVFSFIGNRI